MNFMINALTSMTVGEKLTYGGQMLLLGLGAVFSVLCIIFLCLTIFKFVFTKNSTPKAKAEPAPVVVDEPIVVAPVASSNDDEVVAVIMAAISAYISADPALAEEYAGGFRVVSFRRTSGGRPWNVK